MLTAFFFVALISLVLVVVEVGFIRVSREGSTA
jgi:hypothetical protein